MVPYFPILNVGYDFCVLPFVNNAKIKVFTMINFENEFLCLLLGISASGRFCYVVFIIIEASLLVSFVIWKTEMTNYRILNTANSEKGINGQNRGRKQRGNKKGVGV